MAKIITDFLESEGTDINGGITEEDCWDFFSDHMAPFTAPSKTTTESRCSTETSKDTACMILKEFLQSLGSALNDIPTYRVSNS